MELALLVYFIGMLTPIIVIVSMLLFISAFGVVIFAVSIATSLDYAEKSYNRNYDGTIKDSVIAERKLTIKVCKYSTISLVISVLLLIATPSEKTAYTMVGAYAAQKIVTDPKVQETSSKVLAVINKKLDAYIKDK